MDRRTTLVTAGVSALITVTATAAVAVNTGLLSVPHDDVAGTLELPAAAETAATTGPPEVETVYVDVYDQPGAAPQQEVVVVPAETASAVGAASTDPGDPGYDDSFSVDDDSYDDSYEDEDEFEDGEDGEDGEDEDEYEDGEEFEDEEEEEEYEGRDDDD